MRVRFVLLALVAALALPVVFSVAGAVRRLSAKLDDAAGCAAWTLDVTTYHDCPQ